MTECPWYISQSDGFSPQDIENLTLIDKVGLHVEIVDPTPGAEFMGHRDRHGTPASDSVILWFETEDDFHAFGQVTTRAAEDEFGCDWAYIYPTGLRAEFVTGQFAAAVPRADLPTVATLMRRELAGEFALTPRQASRRRILTWGRRFNLVMIAALLAQLLFFREHFTGWGWAGLFCALVAFMASTTGLENPYLRVTLDRVRAQQTAEVAS